MRHRARIHTDATRLLTRTLESLPLRSIERDILVCACLYLEGDHEPGYTVARWWAMQDVLEAFDRIDRKKVKETGFSVALTLVEILIDRGYLDPLVEELGLAEKYKQLQSANAGEPVPASETAEERQRKSKVHNPKLLL